MSQAVANDVKKAPIDTAGEIAARERDLADAVAEFKQQEAAGRLTGEAAAAHAEFMDDRPIKEADALGRAFEAAAACLIAGIQYDISQLRRRHLECGRT